MPESVGGRVTSPALEEHRGYPHHRHSEASATGRQTRLLVTIRSRFTLATKPRSTSETELTAEILPLKLQFPERWPVRESPHLEVRTRVRVRS